MSAGPFGVSHITVGSGLAVTVTGNMTRSPAVTRRVEIVFLNTGTVEKRLIVNLHDLLSECDIFFMLAMLLV